MTMGSYWRGDVSSERVVYSLVSSKNNILTISKDLVYFFHFFYSFFSSWWLPSIIYTNNQLSLGQLDMDWMHLRMNARRLALATSTASTSASRHGRPKTHHARQQPWKNFNFLGKQLHVRTLNNSRRFELPIRLVGRSKDVKFCNKK